MSTFEPLDLKIIVPVLTFLFGFVVKIIWDGIVNQTSNWVKNRRLRKEFKSEVITLIKLLRKQEADTLLNSEATKQEGVTSSNIAIAQHMHIPSALDVFSKVEIRNAFSSLSSSKDIENKKSINTIYSAISAYKLLIEQLHKMANTHGQYHGDRMTNGWNPSIEGIQLRFELWCVHNQEVKDPFDKAFGDVVVKWLQKKDTTPRIIYESLVIQLIELRREFPNHPHATELLPLAIQCKNAYDQILSDVHKLSESIVQSSKVLGEIAEHLDSTLLKLR